jgi:ribosomal protein S18 acetylase RimI-like enzyme
MNEELTFKKATLEDLNEVYQVIQNAIIEMKRDNIPQWDDQYPNRDILKEDIEKEQLYIVTLNSSIITVYVLNEEYDEQYRNGNWSSDKLSFRIIHRLCVNPNYQNMGLGGKVLNHIEQELKDNGIQSVRLDVFSKNPFALRLYEKLGYQKVGEAYWRKGTFHLMEKIL